MITILDLYKWKNKHEKFAAITAYDSTFSQIFFEQGIKVILVGDSLGMTVQGNNSTIGVTMKDMIYHTKCVRHGAPSCFLITDLPFMSYTTLDQALNNSAKLIRAGANMVKMEGGSWLSETIKNLTVRSIPVCGHIGLTPQSINISGGFKIKGRKQSEADQIFSDAIALEEAGALMVVLECIPVQLAKRITESLSIPTIGIGSGSTTDGQILVMQDILGITKNFTPSFAKIFLSPSDGIQSAIRNYVQEVENNTFPSDKNSFY